MKKIVSLLLIIISLTLLASCGVTQFEYADGGLVIKGTSEKYSALPVGFEPCGIGEKCGKFGEFDLYKVTGINGEDIGNDWITEEYSGNATTVFTKEEMPPFRNIEFDACYVCEEDTSVISIETITNKEDIKKIISSLDSDEKALWPRNDLISTYTLKFYSEEFPAVFYSLTFSVCESGNYLFDRAEKNCVVVNGILENYTEK